MCRQHTMCVSYIVQYMIEPAQRRFKFLVIFGIYLLKSREFWAHPQLYGKIWRNLACGQKKNPGVSCRVRNIHFGWFSGVLIAVADSEPSLASDKLRLGTGYALAGFSRKNVGNIARICWLCGALNHLCITCKSILNKPVLKYCCSSTM